MTADTTDTTNDATTRTRAPRGTATPAERIARVRATLRGLAADVLENPSADVENTYRAALQAVIALQTAYEQSGK